jgi:hypothetical protein
MVLMNDPNEVEISQAKGVFLALVQKMMEDPGDAPGSLTAYAQQQKDFAFPLVAASVHLVSGMLGCIAQLEDRIEILEDAYHSEHDHVHAPDHVHANSPEEVNPDA